MLRVIKSLSERSVSSKPVILTFVRYYLPGYKSGGPVRTIANMVAALGDEFDFRVVTSDRDATDTARYNHLDSRAAWYEVGKAKVLYLSPSQRSLRKIARIIREIPHDTLYLNSFFDPHFTQKPLLARCWLGVAPETRCVIAPRGEFSQGALALKPIKKKAFLLIARSSGLYRDLEWHASSLHEAADIRRALGSIARRVHVAMDLPDVTSRSRNPPATLFKARAPGDPLRIVFLSRISPMKNLDFALEVLQHVQVPVCFDIYGPIRDEEYWSRCQQLIARLPPTVGVRYRGCVDHEKVLSTIADYDCFFLPTLGENYGHAIFESLSAGTPVLIADTTPWRNLEEAEIGWDLPLEKPEEFAKKIDSMARMTFEEQARMRIRAREFADKHCQNSDVVEANRRLLNGLLPS